MTERDFADMVEQVLEQAHSGNVDPDLVLLAMIAVELRLLREAEGEEDWRL